MDIKTKISTYWVVVMMNLIFADILSIMLELVHHNTINLPAEANFMMAIAAIFTNIPILMIYFSRALPIKYNKIFNLIAAVFTFCYIILGGSITPHYIIIATIESIFLLLIFKSALKWRIS